MKNITKKLPKKNNAADGQKARNDNTFYKVGRIRYNSWAAIVLKACDIIVYDRELVHIYNRHRKELDKLGFSAFEYVKFIVNNFNEIYNGKLDRKLLAVKSVGISHYAVVELVFERNKYVIKTAVSVETQRLSKLELLCANARRT